VTGEPRRPVPADMLLVRERRRRIAGTPREIVAAEASLVSEEIFVSDEDQLIEPEAVDEPSSIAGASSDVLLRRPMAHVSLAQVSWSGPIDHDTLQEAIACSAADTRDVLVHAGLFFEPPFRHDGSAALEVTLRANDLKVMSSLAAAGAGLHATPIIRAARLPDRLTGTEAATRQAVSPVLGAYRRSSLEYAWQKLLSRTQSAQLHRERDEAAVAVLSTLRALLGER
jgi:hypothetical protein